MDLLYNGALPHSTQQPLNGPRSKVPLTPSGLDNGYWRYGQRAAFPLVANDIPFRNGDSQDSHVSHPVEYSPTWIRGIGIFFCLLNIVLFLTNCICLSARFYLRPGSLRLSFIDEVEALFIPAFVSPA